MYDELIRSCRACATGYVGNCDNCMFSGEDCYKQLHKASADAIEHMQKTIVRLENELGIYIEVLSKMEKTTQQDERLTPKKPNVSVDTWVCPKCGRDVEFQEMLGDNILFHGQHDYCPNCGQAIDWTEPHLRKSK